MERNISSSSAYRKLRTNVEYNEKHPHMHSICLTSVNHGAGTTTVACELATAFAANRSKVLLIDCDINKPMVHECFKIQNKVGLTEILDKKDYVNYEKYTSQFKDAYSNNVLYVMSAGSNLKHPIDLLSGQDFKEFMEIMKAEFDFIIIDCPSLEDSSDAIPVSHIVDGTILVISLPETEKKLAKESIERLKRNGAVIVGTILNKVE